MENQKPTKIDSWEPAEEHRFKYPKGKEIPESLKKMDEDLTPELIKAFKEGLGSKLKLPKKS